MVQFTLGETGKRGKVLLGTTMLWWVRVKVSASPALGPLPLFWHCEPWGRCKPGWDAGWWDVGWPHGSGWGDQGCGMTWGCPCRYPHPFTLWEQQEQCQQPQVPSDRRSSWEEPHQVQGSSSLTLSRILDFPTPNLFSSLCMTEIHLGSRELSDPSQGGREGKAVGSSLACPACRPD